MKRAILTSDIGINPTNDGRVMRLVFPAPTEERRRQLTKEAMHMGEEAKIAVRNVRRDAHGQMQSQEKGGRVDRGRFEKPRKLMMQKITDKYAKEIDKTCEAKNKEIMEI